MCRLTTVIRRDSVSTPVYCWCIASHLYACCLPMQPCLLCTCVHSSNVEPKWPPLCTCVHSSNVEPKWPPLCTCVHSSNVAPKWPPLCTCVHSSNVAPKWPPLCTCVHSSNVAPKWPPLCTCVHSSNVAPKWQNIFIQERVWPKPVIHREAQQCTRRCCMTSVGRNFGH